MISPPPTFDRRAAWLALLFTGFAVIGALYPAHIVPIFTIPGIVAIGIVFRLWAPLVREDGRSKTNFPSSS